MQLNLKVRPVKRLTKIREVFLVHFQTDGEVISSELLGEPSKHLVSCAHDVPLEFRSRRV